LTEVPTPGSSGAFELENLTLVRATEAELPDVGIHDTLRVCLLYATTTGAV
jgi:hypothetical protein